jgi:hypothetical protein
MYKLGFFIALFASHTLSVIADCRVGDALCQREAGASSWCRREDFTCQGKPKVKCTCDPPAESSHTSRPKPNHRICIERVGPESWCRDDLTCQGRPDIKCGDAAIAAPASSTKSAAKPRTVITTVAPVAVARTGTVAPLSHSVVPVSVGALNHAICTAIDPASWCKESGFCHKHDHVPCRGAVTAAAAAPTLRRRPEVPSERPAGTRVTHRATTSPTDTMILWTEWPTLEEGAWPDYFSKLREFLTGNCAGIRFHRVVMRVLDPTFQRSRGELWQVSRTSSFYVDFLRHLPASIDVHIYPYLLDEESALKWSGDGRDAHSALEGVFKYIRNWNDLLIEDGLPVRLGGVVCDKEEGRNFLHDLRFLDVMKERYSTRGGPRLKFGLAIGFDTAGSIPSFSDEIDNFYLEMYDWYEQGRKPVRKIIAEEHDAVNKPSMFVDLLERLQQLGRHYHRYREHDRIVFMWSLQNRGSNQCMFPLNDNTCGERNDFGSWTGHHFRQFLSELSSRESVFAQRQHALFQFSYVPLTWHPRSGCD